MALREKIKNYHTLDYEQKMAVVEDITATLIEKYDEIINSDIDPKLYNDTVKSISQLLKNLSTLNIHNREAAMKDNIDFTHPKIQKGMYFLMEVVINTLKETGISEEQINVFANNLSINLIGFEDKLNSELKKLSSTLVDTAKNPLIEKVLGKDA